MLNPIFIKATTLNDAWHQSVFTVLEHGRPFKIDKGSFAGEYRLELDYVTIQITHPESRPLEPKLPESLGIPDPVPAGYILGDDPSFTGEPYINYIMGNNVKDGELYSYGQRISGYDYYEPEKNSQEYNISSDSSLVIAKKKSINQIEYIIDTFKKYGYRNNQMVLQIAVPQDLLLEDPACVTPDVKILTKRGYVNANNITMDDYVLTHTGNWKRVTKIYERKYSGKLNKLTYKGFERNITITPNHPIYTIKGKYCPYDNPPRSRCKPNCKKQYSVYAANGYSCKQLYNNYTLDWIDAKNVEINDYIMLPYITEINPSEYTTEVMWLFGIFLAQGHYAKKDGIIFSINENHDSVIEDITEIMKKQFNLEPRYKYSQGCIGLIFYSREIANKFLNLFGKGALNKSIPPQFLTYPKNHLDSLLNGFIDGDGYCRDNKITFSTSSESLKDMFKIILSQCGIIPNIRKTEPKDRIYNNRIIKMNAPNYIFEYTENRTKNIGNWTDNNQNKYIPITDNIQIDYDGFVYNYEVEDDHSYVANGMVVHNCLRLLDCRIQDNKLHFMGYWRSWDNWSGLPSNLAGIQILKEYMADEIGVDPGETIAASKGLHLYKYVWELAELRRQTTGKVSKILDTISEGK